MKQTLGGLADKMRGRVLGDKSIAIANVASITSAAADSLVFVEDLKTLERALASPAAAVIAGEFAANSAASKPILISSQPRLTFARATKLLYDAGKVLNTVHSSAIVPASVQIGKNIAIGPRAVLGENVKLGAGTMIGAGCRLDANVTIYSGTTLGDRVVVQSGAVLGSEGFGYVRDSKTGHYEQFPQVGRLIIEDDVEIGANSTIDRGALDETRIRRGTKIDNLVQVGHNVQIGQDVVIAAQTGLSGSAVVEDNVIIGGQVGIADRVRIEAGAI